MNHRWTTHHHVLADEDQMLEKTESTMGSDSEVVGEGFRGEEQPAAG